MYKIWLFQCNSLMNVSLKMVILQFLFTTLTYCTPFNKCYLDFIGSELVTNHTFCINCNIFLNLLCSWFFSQPNRTVYCASHILVQPNFRRYNVYFLPDQAQIPFDHFNVLDELWGEISTGFDNRWRISPYTPNCPLSATL